MADQPSLPTDGGSTLKLQLAQREAELAIINSIQQGLASRLKVQSIYDLVGDEIRDFFNAQVVMISTYDAHTESIEHRYAIERGERVYAPGTFPIRGFRTHIVQTRQPVLVNANVAEQAARLGQPTLPGTITPKSWLGVPMLVSDEVTGILSLQNVEEENAFDESDVRLLQTFASSMSVALENARLFDETHGHTGMFATIFFGILDPRTGVLTYINGGHRPPLLIDKHGEKAILKPTGPAVGAVSDVDYAVREVLIVQGDTFFAYTDGLTDTANASGEHYREQELIPMFASDEALSSLLAQIQQQIDTYATGVQQFDDITMLAVRRLAN